MKLLSHDHIIFANKLGHNILCGFECIKIMLRDFINYIITSKFTPLFFPYL